MSEIKKTSKKSTVKKEEVKVKKIVKKEKEVKAVKAVKAVVEKKSSVAKPLVKKEALSSKYIQATGRRKTAVAQVRLYYPGKGDVVINNTVATEFLSEDNLNVALQPIKSCSKLKDFDFSVIVRGGGSSSQIEAIRHGIARTLLKYDPELKTILKTNGYLTRDPRKKERKKPGLKKARKAPQWSKR
ncbi:30S ribosomal protein S9 [Candidatus Falkowbacteria bacterium HGW-Falkowbacteria-1]|jgi:small subunit ribosomal protein S9|uniref:Small ribosomal subunit protein uS9 n=1 Tax=Candidatus Falkowbacteria bacterium HGW-Falkowbacteria-1 TaxID=2013768 RepID=A0A2N2E9S1_9BACT|nr:MAG: 30S ribosomal protein S9 [Candidatus Falkowbacteria bacterium HGW-Falkowbacteria-1]